MTTLRAIFSLLLLAFLAAGLNAQELAVEVESLTSQGMVKADQRTGLYTATGGVMVRYGTMVLVAERASVNPDSGDVEAEGDVRIQRDEMLWVGEHIRYNFKTRYMEAGQYRTGKWPVFVAGQGLQGNYTNRTYEATNSVITTDDTPEPFQTIHARYIKIVPGQYIEAHHAVLYVGGVPVFYFPYYSRKLGVRSNQFLTTPGYRSVYGPYLLNSYTWYLNEQLDGAVHLDYRQRRGIGVGPDVNAQFGRWGQGSFKYYYLHDDNPEQDLLGFSYPENRQMLWLEYQATPWTNLNFKAVARFQSDADMVKEFREMLYRDNPHPDSFFEVNKSWQNWSLDALAQPRVNDFLETVERLPDVKLTGFRQQIGPLPVFYESESSAGYFHRRFAVTNGPVAPDFAAARADTYHQLVVPETLFGWLNVTPRVGGRFTYYGEESGTGGTNREEFRGVFNTGAEVSFKASRLWPNARNKLFDVNGLRHIIEPSINYVFVPSPNVLPPQLPQFDYETPSLRLLPIEYPDYNAIDSIDSQNVLRFGLRNKLQTKREDGLDNLINWELFTDWRLRPHADQNSFSDIYSAIAIKPRSWLSLESENRFDFSSRRLNLSRETLWIQPNSTWSWGFTYYYLRPDWRPLPTAWGIGSQVVNNTVYYRVNENWGFRASHYYDVMESRLAEQAYSIYRDLRSWTAAVIVRLRNPTIGPRDFTVGITLSLKGHPRYPVGGDSVERYGLLGY